MEHLQPPDLVESQRFGFTQVITSAPGKLVTISGQTAWNRNLEVVGGDDLGGQATQALANVGLALAAAGATPADLISLRIYVVGYQPQHAAVVGKAVADFLGDTPPPTQTLLGVQALAVRDFLIEIEASAVVAP